MDENIPSIYDNPITSFADVVLPEPDRDLEEMHRQFSDDVRATDASHYLTLQRIPKTVNNLSSLKIFMETALKIFLKEILHFDETVVATLQLLKDLKKEATHVFDSIVQQIRNATPRGTLPPEKRFTIFPCIRGAMDLILQHVNEQILILEEHHPQVQGHMLILKQSVRTSLSDSYEKAREILSQPGRHGDDAATIQNILNTNMVEMSAAINDNLALLRHIQLKFLGQRVSGNRLLITARKMIQTARNTAASCSGRLGAWQVTKVMNAVHNAMFFTKRANLIAAEYKMDMAVKRLLRTYDLLESANTHS